MSAYSKCPYSCLLSCFTPYVVSPTLQTCTVYSPPPCTSFCSPSPNFPFLSFGPNSLCRGKGWSSFPWCNCRERVSGWSWLSAHHKLCLHIQEETEIPARAFQKAPELLGPEDQSVPGPEEPVDEAGESSDEEPVESRAQRLRRTGLQKVQSLRRALSSRKGPEHPTPVKPPRLGHVRSNQGPTEGQPAAQRDPPLESALETEPPQATKEDPGRPVLQIESTA